MSQENEKLWANCRTCSRQTRHTVLLKKVVEDAVPFYRDRDTWQIVRCDGCLSVGFRHLYEDFEIPIEDDEGETHPSTKLQQYPRSLLNHRRLPTTYLPRLIRRIYEQTLSAYGEDAHVLTSIGLRATIEAICTELNVAGPTLEKRIDKLFKEGHVSNADKKRLHAIRFLGNDAAHQIIEPSEQDIRVALEIVENLLNSVFILEQRAQTLDSGIEGTEDFSKFVAKRIARLRKEQTLSLKGLLGKKYRLVGV